jgi:hypothetical protein
MVNIPIYLVKYHEKIKNGTNNFFYNNKYLYKKSFF